MAHDRNARLADIIASAMDAIIAIDEEQRVIVFNAAAERIFGHRGADVMGKQHDLLFPERFRAQHMEHIRRFSASGETSRRMGELGEIVGLRASGQEFPLEASISQTGSSPNKLFTAFLRDISERRRSELALRASELRLEGVIASVAEGVISIDADFRIVLFNPAAEQMFGRSLNEMLGRPLSVLIPERFRAQHEEHIRKFATTGQTNRSLGKYGPIYGLRASGEEFPIEATVSQTETSRNKLFTVILRDISERKRAEERIRMFSQEIIVAREKERKQVSSVLHHDVGSLAVGLAAHLDTIEEYLRSGKQGEALKWMKRTRKLFDESVVRLKGVAFQLRPLELDVLGLRAALRQYFSQITKHGGIRIQFRETLGRMRVSGDTATILFRVAQEALTNAITHGHATRVGVVLRVSKKEVRLTVHDNGKGFNPSKHWAPEASQIGVRVMQEMAAFAEGAFAIESGRGKGTTVRVSLPHKTAALGPGDVTVREETVARGKTTRSAGRGSWPQKGSGA